MLVVEQVQSLIQSASQASQSLEELVVEADDVAVDLTDGASSTAWQDAAEAAELCMEGLAEIYEGALRDALVDTTEELAVCLCLI